MQQFSIVIKIIALASYFILVMVVMQSRAERNVRIYFAIYLFGMLFWQFTSLMVNFSTTAKAALFWYNLIIAGSGTFNILFFPFTRAFLKIKKQKLLTVLGFLSCGIMFATGIMGLTWREAVIGQGGYWVPVYNSGWLLVIGPIWYLFWLCGIMNLIRGLVREKSSVQRNRILYVLVGAVLVIAAVSSNLTALRDFPVDTILNLVSAVTIGYAVMRYRLLDIRFILARSIFYSVLTASLIAAYLGIVFGLEGALQESIGYTGPGYGIVAILVLSILFLPLRNSLQRLLDRIFFRDRADYQSAIQAFSASMTSLYDLDAILNLVGTMVAKTIKTTHVSIALADEARKAFVATKRYGEGPATDVEISVMEQSRLARWLRKEGKPLVREEALLDPSSTPLIEESRSLFESANVSIVVPVLLNERLMGTLNLGEKRAGTIYTDEDLRFLTTIANQTATAVEKSSIFREIRRRLSEQTLLFILSEKFRSSMDFDSLMTSIVQVLKSFLTCDHCALVSFDKAGEAKGYFLDPESEAAADFALMLRNELLANPSLITDDSPIPAELIRSKIRQRENIPEALACTLGSLVYLPLREGADMMGILIVANRAGTASIDDRELELLRTIRSIIMQGMMLYRTIRNLMNVETYNENILNSLNDMGDTLIILDLNGSIKSVNRATCKTLGYSEEELVGRDIGMITGDGDSRFTTEVVRRLITEGSISNYEVNYRANSGKFVPMLLSGSLMVGEDGKTREIVGIARDMTEHHKVEEANKNLLLMQEIHHRIKNNLQVISSLLLLQSKYVKDEETREMFKESQNRVRTMALLHEKLYRSRTQTGVEFSEYIAYLTNNIFTSYGVSPTRVNYTIEISDINLGMDTAVPCGLIINELISNVLKHAFPGERTGKVLIRMKTIERPEDKPQGPDGEQWYQLTVADDGEGFPEDLDFRATGSLGLKLVTTLTHQLSGDIELERNGGTTFNIRFKGP
jgi:PAS domain S-box-containing protein